MPRVRSWVALLITVVWLGSYVASVIQHNYVGLQYTTPVMLVAAGGLLGSDLMRRNGNGNGKH